MTDYNNVESVGVQISADGNRLWVCIDGQCVLRVRGVEKLIDVRDDRSQTLDVNLDPLLNTPIYTAWRKWRLGVRELKAFVKLGIKTVSDLIEFSEQDLLSVKGFGVTSLSNVKGALSQHGLTLRKDKVCCVCKSEEKVSLDPNPYELEIHGDDTLVWMCEDCRRNAVRET